MWTVRRIKLWSTETKLQTDTDEDCPWCADVDSD